MYRLFDEFAHRYDLHTPAHHYQHDHRFVLDLARNHGAKRLLDIGCGTGAFLEAARAIGLDARGLDAARGMVDVATKRLGPDVVEHRAMQHLDVAETYDIVVSLSWSLNYCEDWTELGEVLRRTFRALRPGGVFIAQVAHAAHATGELFEDCERGPSGTANDVRLFYRFSREGSDRSAMRAEYVYVCVSANELAFETHHLHTAAADMVARMSEDTGFTGASLFDSYRRDRFSSSVSPWLIAKKEP